MNSGGGDVQATAVVGPLTLISENGNVMVRGLTGDLAADTGGGSLSGDDVAAERASVSTEDGSAMLAFSTAPG